MANDSCINGKLDDGKYSSPMPAIGLYIAAASLVCLLAMLFDIVSGFRCRKPWIPCRLFSMNSVTLTLLSIAAKLPVDLTTAMPGPREQFSKLSGTTLLCVSICFLMPSLGSNQKSEGLNNMAALSILVVTIVVNICMQIHTGVIFMFIAEHVAIMYFMVALLMTLWIAFYLIVHREKDVSLDLNKDLIRKGPGSMLQRVKLCYLYGFNYDPQLGLCLNSWSFVYVGVGFASVVVIAPAAFRSIVLQQPKHCGGVSDYSWSIWIIIATQFVAIIVGGFGTCLRYIVLFGKASFDARIRGQGQSDARDERRLNPLLGTDWRDNCVDILEPICISLSCLVLLPVLVCSVVLQLTLEGVCKKFIKRRETWGNADADEYLQYMHLIREGDMGLRDWTLWKCLKNMRIWTEASKLESKHLPCLLSRTLPSQQLHPMVLKDQAHPDEEGIEVSSLSMGLLIRIAEVSIPSKFSAALVQTFNEVYEIVHFIETRVNPVSFTNNKKYELARAVRIRYEFSSQSYTRSAINKRQQTDWDQHHAVRIITELRSTTLVPNLVWNQIVSIINFMRHRRYSSVEDLYSFMEQMFVDMLHILLSQLPLAIYKEITESPAEEFEERSRRALKILYKVESSESHIHWSFPAGCNISSFITPEVQDDSQLNANASTAPVTENSDHNGLTNNVEVSVQVE